MAFSSSPRFGLRVCARDGTVGWLIESTMFHWTIEEYGVGVGNDESSVGR